MRRSAEERVDEVRSYRSGVCGRLTRVMAASLLSLKLSTKRETERVETTVKQRGGGGGGSEGRLRRASEG